MIESSDENVIDNILSELGIGKFQLINFMFLGLPVIFILTSGTSYIFTSRDATYRCSIPECEFQDTEYNKSWLSRALPFEDGEPKKCERYTSVKTNISTEQNEGECNVVFNNNITELCTEWIFKKGDSIVEELDIPCEDWKRSLVGSLNSAGQLVSLIFSGFISDKYGRRNVMVILTVLGGIFGLIQSFSQTYWMFAILEFLTHLFGSGAYAIVYVMAVEILPAKSRIYGCAIIEFICSTSIASVGLLAWAADSWRILLRITSIPSFIMLISFFVIPENMRWLYAKGRKRECLQIIQNAAKMNKVSLSNGSTIELCDRSSNSVETTKDSKDNIDSHMHHNTIWKSKILLVRLCMCAFCWFASVLSYNGTLINTVNVVGSSFNEYLSFFLITLVELPSIIAYLLILRFLRRKVGIFFAFLGSGIILIIYGAVPITNDTTELLLYIMGKFFITLSFILMYIFTTEIFPTNMRNSTLSFCSIAGRIGGMLAPQVLLFNSISKSLPMIVFGVLPLVATIAALNLPESRNKKLPDTIKEAENL